MTVCGGMDMEDAVTAAPLEVALGGLEETIADATAALQGARAEDGHWVFELEADVTIPSEYILLEHYLDEIDTAVEAELAGYIRARQGAHGGWPLFHGGDFNISASVKAYYALKLAGDDPEAPHMQRARAAILEHGGAESSNVFTRYALALFGQVPWRAVPVMPVEIMLLPRWFPFHLSRVSYWSRTVIVPLLILYALQPRARNPSGIGIKELFRTPPQAVRNYQHNPTGAPMGEAFLLLDRALRVVEPLLPRRPRRRAMELAVRFITERLNGEDGLGAIYPAMANAVMAFDALGYPRDHPDLVTAKAAVRKLLTKEDGELTCQPCVSPVWDTALSLHALMESEGEADPEACRWLVERQVLDVKGDWAQARPDLRPGGWPFQYRNDHYLDLDDTAVVGLALHRAGNGRYREAVDRAAEWVLGMQSRNGGWASFDVDNTHDYLNNIPFADHGALLDPPTSDVTARVIGFLAQIGYERTDPAVARGLDFLRREQEPDGSWFGRWGTNYVYGTWSVLCAFNAVDEPLDAPHIRRAVDWLLSRQRPDGGWGEDGATYWQEHRDLCKASTPSQTAWAVLGLMAAGEVDHPAVRRGIAFLLESPRRGAEWEEPWYTAVGFPRVFYLRYHGYRRYFPLWALARYRNLTLGNSKRVAYGM